MEDGGDQKIFEREVELDSEELAVEDVDAELEDGLADTVPSDLLDDETRLLAAGLASLDEGELLSALEAMQKAVIGPNGGKVLACFVLASPHCTEIMGAWERGPAAATAVPVMLLLYYMFRHPLDKVGIDSGDYNAGDSITEKEAHRKAMAVKLRLDKLARSIVRTRIKDFYSHLSSSQKSRQNVALLLLSAIVLRGRALAIEIATSFDFTLEALRKLGHLPKQGASKTVRVEGHRGILKQPTRVAFVELAISFLTVGDPGLLRWILQKRPLWIGVLHGISKDDERTIVRVFTLVEAKVMAPAFMVPRGLQSVLFGDATLEQLARISSDHSLGEAGELAHAILISLCTDPSHGLCPAESEFLEAAPSRSKTGVYGGGQGRLLRLMLRLKVTEVDRHRDVLLATFRARPHLAISYLASFPLSLEPRVSPAWFKAMSLVSQLIPIASQPSTFLSLEPESLLNGHLMQNMLHSLLPTTLSRVVLNRGLLHVDFMVKHASLRVLVEALICLRRLINAMEDSRTLGSSKGSSAEIQCETKRVNSFVTSIEPGVIEDSLKQKLMKVCQSIQDLMRASLPDPNTLLTMLSSLKLPHNLKTNIALVSSEQSSPATKKRKRNDEQNSQESHELKSSISGSYDYDGTMRLLWGSEFSDESSQREGIEEMLYSKAVQVLAAYQVALPVAMADTGFDAFKLLPEDPSSLSCVQQRSLSALLLATMGSSSLLQSKEAGWFVTGFAGSGSAYKSFKQLLMFMLNSEVEDVRAAVYEVAHRVMSSTGAFESNPVEISLWLDLLVRTKIEGSTVSHNLDGIINVVNQGTSRTGSIYVSLVDFLSEAVSSIGQNSFKYLDSLHSIPRKSAVQGETEKFLLPSASLQGFNTSEIGPFVVCTLETFLHNISKSTVPVAYTTVGLYLVNVLDLLLKHQMDPLSLAMVIVTILSRERESLSPKQLKSPEWIVLLVLFERAQLLLSDDRKTNSTVSSTTSASKLGHGYQGGKLADSLRGCRMNKDMPSEEKILIFTSSIGYVSTQELVDNFPLLMRFCLEDLHGDFFLPLALLGIHQGVLARVSTAWPELFTGGLELASRAIHSSEGRVTAGKVQEELTVTLGLEYLTVETHGFCALLLVAPFPVLFSAASFCREPALLALPSFTKFLQAALLRAHHRNWVSMVRLIISGINHLAALSIEAIGDGAPIHTSFSLLRSLVLPVEQSPGGSFLSDKLKCPPKLMAVYEDVLADLLKHPALFNLFMHGGQNRIPTMTPCPYANDLRRESKDEIISDTVLRRTLTSAASCVHSLDCHVLSLLVQILGLPESIVRIATISSESQGAVGFWRKILSAFKPYAVKVIGAFQKDVDESSTSGVFPSAGLSAVSALIAYTDPSFLLRLFLSLLSTKARKVRAKQAVSPHVLGLHFVTVFLHSLAGGAPHSRTEVQLAKAWTWDRNTETHSGGSSIYDLFEKVVDHVIESPSIMADLCLLSFLQASKLNGSPLLGFEMSLNKTSTALTCSTPLEVLRHCVCHPNKVTGKIAFLLVETSLVHLTEFGRLITVGTADRGQVISKNIPSLGFAEMLLTRGMGNQQQFLLSDQDLLYLLPAAQSYIVTESSRDATKANEFVIHIASVYTKLLTMQLRNWGKFVSERVGTDGVEDMRLSITTLQPHGDMHDMLRQLYNCSPLGQVVHMLQSGHIFHSFSMKVKARLIQSLLPEDDSPLVKENVWLSAGEDVTLCVLEAVAKADIIRYFLSSASRSQAIQNVSTVEKGGQEMGQRTQSSEVTSLEESSVWLQFLRCLVNTLGMLYKSEALDGNWRIDANVMETRSEAGKTHWVKFLEEYFLTQVTNAAKKLAGSSFKMSEYFPLYKHCMTTLLRYRYGETSAMKACRYVTFVVFQGLQSQMVPKDILAKDDVLELLIAHSKFLPSLLIMDSSRMNIPHIAGKHVGKGTSLNSLSSILSLIGSPILHVSAQSRRIFPGQDSEGKGKFLLNGTDVNRNSRDSVKPVSVEGAVDDVDRLEIVKLLRIILGVRLKQLTLSTLDSQSVSLDDVMSILLAAYGGTLSSVDQEIFLLMQEIESHGGLGVSGLSRFDYLWGETALKRRRAKAEGTITNTLKEQDSMDELRRQAFKEDLLIDPRRCGLAVLFFPLKRKFGVADVGQFGVLSQYEESNEETSVKLSESTDEDLKDAAYDPAFLLPFALHGLSIGCMNAEEFVQLGLLAIAFASMSSAEESMRKAGYELLAKYFSVLEDGPSFKGRLQIRLLMTFVKNAVTEPWQRIPVVFSVFAAEASCILMHPESHQYAAINRFLLRAPNLDLESVPLFQVMFGSGSVQYRSDRLWMLRLLACGLRTSLDARVYRRKFVLELLMSFHDSSMADTFPRKWVLQVLYQAAGMRLFSKYLVEHTGVLSWLSSVALNDIEGAVELQEDSGSGQIASMALKVIERLLSWEKLQRHSLLGCLEELAKAGHVLYQLLVRNPTHHYQNLLQRSTLRVLLTLVSLSHKRRKHETHFTLNLGALVEVLHLFPGVTSPICLMEDRALGLQLVLHVPPLPVNTHEDKLALFNVAIWAQSVALDLETRGWNGRNSSFESTKTLTTTSHAQESLSEKLLRWVVASVVLGELAREGNEVESREKFFTTLSVTGCLNYSKFSEMDVASRILDEKLASLLLALEGNVSRKIGGTSLVSVCAALIILSRLSRSSIHRDDPAAEEAQQKIQCILGVLLLDLPSPEETNVAWQWSYNSPWTARDESVQSTDESAVQSRYISEICRTIIILVQQMLLRQRTHQMARLSRWESLLRVKPQTENCSDGDPIMKKVSIKLQTLQARLCTSLQRLSSD